MLQRRLSFLCLQVLVLILAITVAPASSYSIRPGPLVQATRGQMWPKPLAQNISQDFYIVDIAHLNFVPQQETCSLLESAISRCWHKVKCAEGVPGGRINDWNVTDAHYVGRLAHVDISLKNPCSGTDLPTEDMDESYRISISRSQAIISAASIWGAIRGLESFSQLVHRSSDGSTLLLNGTEVDDRPRFPHRGLLVDTSRHFIPKSVLLRNLDAMEGNKLNVFHWHITDDQSFPYQSMRFPSMSANGAFHPIAMVYSQQDVQDVIEYARQRGVRVLVEFDTPGHTRSWDERYLTLCPDNNYGPMDPSNQQTFPFLQDFFQEVVNVFPDNYVHIGGDEVSHECWASSPRVKSFMQQHNIQPNDYVALENYFVLKVVDIVRRLGAQPMVWEEVFVNGAQLPNGTIVQVWKNDGFDVLEQVIRSGYPALLSACWYLDHLVSGGDWYKFYQCDPYNLNATIAAKAFILGGEACMWSESVNQYNIIPRIWPRASAVAEKLWSPQDADTISSAAQRLEEHTCRMNARGIEAQPPNGPGFCM